MSSNEVYQIKWVGLLEIRNKKILTVKVEHKDFLQLPGGAQEPNETDLETLKREVKEEVSVEISNPKLYDSFILEGRREGVQIKFVIYTADLPDELVPNEEVEEIVWVDSRYANEGLDVGHPLKLVLIERLKKENLID